MQFQNRRISFAERWKQVAESSEFHWTLSRAPRAHFSNSKYAKKRDILSEKRESGKAGIIIIINKFNGNSTELDSHIYCTYKHIKYKAIQMRRNVIRHDGHVIHTQSIYFVNNTILTYIKCRININ